MPLLGAEMHVLTLETLKMRCAAGLVTYALFVDIKGAYDVPQEALGHILRRAGAPQPLVAFLADWFRTRAADLTRARLCRKHTGVT